MNRIIIPLDGSDASEAAVPYGALLARSLRVPLLLVHVIDTNNILDARALALLPTPEEMTAYLGDIAVREGIAEMVDVEVRRGSPADELLQIGEAEAGGMIVMTTHGRSGLGRIVIGSVADRLVRNGTVPVILIRASQEARIPTQLANLLVTLDGSELAERSLSQAVALARRSGATLHLLRVVEPLASAPAYTYPGDTTWLDAGDIEKLMDEMERDAACYLADVAEDLREGGLTVVPQVLVGRPTGEIMRAEQETEADLMIMASHGRGGVRRWLMGSVTTSFIQQATVPLLIIPARATIEPQMAGAATGGQVAVV